jgi:hypothetical protein
MSAKPGRFLGVKIVSLMEIPGGLEMGDVQIVVTVDETSRMDASGPPGLAEVFGVATVDSVLVVLAVSKIKGWGNLLCCALLDLEKMGESLRSRSRGEW